MRDRRLAIILGLAIFIAVSLPFFVYYSTMSTSTAMKLVPLPTAGGLDSSGHVLSIILYGKSYYAYAQDSFMTMKEHDLNSLRLWIIEKKAEDPNPVVVIKPDDVSPYDQTVAILDEMTNNSITRYTIIKPADHEIGFIRRLKKSE